MDIKALESYSEAWNKHDIEKIMSFMTDDCIFETGGGQARYGTRYEGYDAVKARFIEVWTEIPDMHFINAQHFIDGQFGCSEWTFVGNHINGQTIDVDGCDLFTFKSGKIYSKRSYLKNRT